MQQQPGVLRDAQLLPQPVHLVGEVVKGYGRGSKMLGIPTANLPQSALEQLPADFATGIYFGWATVDGRGPYKMVTSVGWNPYFQNKTKTVEPHLLHEFENDFYGAEIRLVITGYLRPEANFDTLEKLIDAINEDISASHQALETPKHKALGKSPFLFQALEKRVGRTALAIAMCVVLGAGAFVYWKRTAKS